MKVEEILMMDQIVNDRTEIYIRDGEFNMLASGNWFNDNVLDHSDDEVECFSWQDDNKVYIDVKQEATLFTDEELEKVENEEERQHLIECAADNSKLDEWYMQIMTKYGLWKGEK